MRQTEMNYGDCDRHWRFEDLRAPDIQHQLQKKKKKFWGGVGENLNTWTKSTQAHICFTVKWRLKNERNFFCVCAQITEWCENWTRLRNSFWSEKCTKATEEKLWHTRFWKKCHRIYISSDLTPNIQSDMISTTLLCMSNVSVPDKREKNHKTENWRHTQKKKNVASPAVRCESDTLIQHSPIFPDGGNPNVRVSGQEQCQSSWQPVNILGWIVRSADLIVQISLPPLWPVSV